MATNSANVLVGAATVTIGGWVASAATTTMTDVGHTKGPVEIGSEFEQFEAMSERSMGPVKIRPTGAKWTVHVPALEITMENMAIAYKQPTANVSGSAPNRTIRIGDPAEQYHKISVVGTSPGTTATGTYTFHRCQISSVAPNPIAKGDSQTLDMTFTVLRDDTVTTADKYFTYVES